MLRIACYFCFHMLSNFAPTTSRRRMFNDDGTAIINL